MAIISGSASKRTKIEHSPSKKQVKMKSTATSPKKRNNCPGIRVKGARIYDSKDGKTCHQCRQKTRDFSAACMNPKEGKPCTVRFCHKCLLNRYGEQAEVVSQLGDWNCPKCRGICNCSFCMKKKGHQPTGQLVLTAKANGFSSVSQMLQVGVVERLDSKKDLQNTGSLHSETVAAEKENSPNMSKKHDKENVVDRKIDPNFQAKPSSPICAQKKSTRDVVEVVNDRRGKSPVGVAQARVTRQSAQKARVLKDVSDVNVPTVELEEGKVVVKPQCNGDLNNCNVGDPKQDNVKGQASTQAHCNEMETKTIPQPEERKFKKPKQDVFQEEDYSNVLETLPTNSETTDIVLNKEVTENILGDKADKTNNMKYLQGGCSISLGAGIENSLKTHIPLPQGTELMNVSGIEIPSEDVGNVLQFLEFCAVFGKVIDVKKGQAEAVVRDILQGRTARRGKCSLTVNFLIQLLSVIQEDEEGSQSPSPSHGNNSWIHSLKQCISDSHDVAKLMDLDLLDEGAHVYESLTTSKKLKLLNFLCDEILGTSKIRNWIDEQTAKLAEKAKEVKSKVLAAKNKEKRLKQKMQDDIAKAVLANNGAPLSISENDAIISKIRTKAAKAHAEVLESQGLLPKGDQTSDAVRIKPILLDASDGRAYWRLNSCSNKSDILSQDVGSGNTVALKEKWSAFDDDQKDAIEKHISSLALKDKWKKKLVAKRSYDVMAKEVSCDM
ncbi:hypothetical protein Leryth_015058 [Lithospermum erythrorhizon]|nr:hypothetical protein Leryth_015058 [Lithospermum erythrorhizon]